VATHVCPLTRQAEEFTDAVIGFMANLPVVPPAEEAGSGGGSGLAGLMQVRIRLFSCQPGLPSTVQSPRLSQTPLRVWLPSSGCTLRVAVCYSIIQGFKVATVLEHDVSPSHGP